MNTDPCKVGILTFHASYNCGSMLQTYALQAYLEKQGYAPEIVDFSTPGQKRIYSVFARNTSPKMMVRNAVLLLHKKRITATYSRYEAFEKQHFKLSSASVSDGTALRDDRYGVVIAGADQIWNVTIADYDDAYFLPWVKSARRIAYAPSFGAKNPAAHAPDPARIRDYLNAFDALSIRERNGRDWIRELTGREVSVVLDPTLLLDAPDYEPITSRELKLPERYIFYYAPSYSLEFNRLVKQISKKYRLPVIAFNSKAFYLRGMNLIGFRLPTAEDPTTYLSLMKHAAMVITTSFHSAIFSTVFRRDFWVIKNGGMLGDDDRVRTLVDQLGLSDRLIPTAYDPDFDYARPVDYTRYEENLPVLRRASEAYLLGALEDRA